MGESLSGPKPWPDILVPCNTTSVVFKYTKKISITAQLVLLFFQTNRVPELYKNRIQVEILCCDYVFNYFGEPGQFCFRTEKGEGALI